MSPRPGPLFQDYSEEFRDIGGRGRRAQAADNDGTITLINQRVVTDDLPVRSHAPGGSWARIY